MPYLKLQTNQTVDPEARQAVAKRLSQAVAEQLGKPESFVMIALEPEVTMCFAGDETPTAFVELKSLGLPEDRTSDLSRSLCALVSNEFGIAEDRIFIEFANAERHMWGRNGKTFAD